MTQKYRVHPGLVDTQHSITFQFNQTYYKGHTGDTLASALLANGEHFVARSFKYHRPRGIFTAGSEEPNALVELRHGAWQDPNTRATTQELYEGLFARSQHYRGSLRFDLMAINDVFAPFLSAGFYYKTFMWPKSFWEKIYEPMIRHSAGLGHLSQLPDPDCYDKGFLHCDVLIIGAGLHGLFAAMQAARSGARVILADEDFRLGGRLLKETHSIDGQPGHVWADACVESLQHLDNVRIMSRTTIQGAYDQGVYAALERCTDHRPSSGEKPRQIFWRIYAKRALLCAGATERSIAFGNNDRPGIMLAGSMRAYLNRWGVAPGHRVAIFTNNDQGWQTALDLSAHNVQVSAVIDVRSGAAPFQVPGARIFMGHQLVDTQGRHRLKSITLTNGEKITVDALGVSGGWNPNVHLTCHQRGKPQWDERIAAFIPGAALPAGMQVCGAARGQFDPTESLHNTLQTTQALLADLGFSTTQALAIPKTAQPSLAIQPFWQVKQPSKRAWVDLQNDVTTKDIRLAEQEGFRSVELLKRYTTQGMATDQGKTSNVLALAILAEARGESIASVGTTLFRPPYTPIAIGALAGRSRGKHFRPFRHTSTHQWAKEQGAEFVEAGLWLRAQWFPKPGESHWRESVDREVKQTRQSVGICDVTTLGKIDIQGRDALTFLQRVYANNFETLAVGRVRYGLMLREDGIVYDDGTTARLSEQHFLMTTTTANAATVYRNLEFYRQCIWPELDVQLISVTEQWAQFAVAGPQSRRLIQKLLDPGHAIDNTAFPFMACAEMRVCGGIPARLFRISFSGELAYEIAVPSRYGEAMMRVLLAAGEEFEAIPYGTEALGVMRIEKGHPAGNELNGQTTALNLGMAAMLKKKSQQTDSIGNVLSQREALQAEDQLRLVGFVPTDPSLYLSAGAHFIPRGCHQPTLKDDEGWMTSVAYSPTLGHSIGLGFIKRGHERLGEIVIAYDELRERQLEVQIVSPHFVDPEGEKLRV